MRHVMPFGAEASADGTTRFALWAPAAHSVELWLEAPKQAVPMERDAGGWARIAVPAPPGTRYRYRIDGDTLVPDPASRFQPEDVHGPSEVIDPLAYRWRDAGWRGMPPEAARLLRAARRHLHAGRHVRRRPRAARSSR